MDRERRLDLGGFTEKRVLGPVQGRVDDAIVHVHGVASRRRRASGRRRRSPPTCRTKTSRRCRECRACPSRSVRASRFPTAESSRASERSSCRSRALSSTSQNGCPDAAARRARPMSGKLLAADRHDMSAGHRRVSRQVRRHRLRIAMREVEDAMAPGSRPVMKVDQATGLCGGIDVPSDPNSPWRPGCEKFGSRPCAMRVPCRPKSSPSKPSTITRRPRAVVPHRRGERECDGRRTGRLAAARDRARARRQVPTKPVDVERGRPCTGRLDAEQPERRRRDVDEGRVFGRHRRLQKNTPGTSRGSMQWSPLHARTLSVNTGPATTPCAHSQETRYPAL